MIKRILIPLDPSPFTETAMEIACTVAKQKGAELTGLVILDIPGIKKSIGPIPMGGLYYAEKLEEHKEKAHSEAELQGSPSERIIRESIFYDLVIIGLRTYFHFETSDKPGDSLEKMMDHSITPIYGVPEKFSILSTEKIKVLISLNESLPAARALKRFVKLADPDIMEFKLLMSHPEKETASYYMDQAEKYLNAYSIYNVEKVWTSQNIIQAMEEQYIDWATIIVLGAHSKKGLFDFMLGSLTKHLIKEAKKPLLIGQ
jgi:nucleotide-binding universal stress UspA family protein